MAMTGAKKMPDNCKEQVAAPARSYQIPGCSVEISSDEDGVSVQQLLAIVFNLASANPDATVDFGIRVHGDG